MKLGRLEGWAAEWGGDGVRLGTRLLMRPVVTPASPYPIQTQMPGVSPAYPLAHSFLISTGIHFCSKPSLAVYSDPAPQGTGERKFQAHSCPQVAHNPVGGATFAPLDTGSGGKEA